MSDRRRRLAALVVAMCIVAPTAGQAETQRFSGEAHDLKSGKLVYTEQYELEIDQGRWRSGITRYVAADGSAIGERRFDFSRDRYVPVFEFVQPGVGYREGITRVDAKQVDVYNVRDGVRQAATLEHVAAMVADCGSQPFLIDHLDALAAGEIVRFTLAVAGRADGYQLRVRKSEDVVVDGRPAMRVRIEIDNLLRLVLPTLELTIDPATKRLVEYSGIANVKDPATRKAYSVRIRFVYP